MIDDLKYILGNALGLSDERIQSLTRDTLLLGNIPEFDSMAVVSVVTALEDQYGFIVDDDEISAETFQTVGSLCAFLEEKIISDAV